MKTRSTTFFNSYCLLLFVCSLSSCTKFIEIPSPVNQLDVNSVFADDKTATAAIVGIYSNMEFSSPVNTYLTLLSGLSADELSYISSDPLFSDLANNTYTPDNQYISSIWGMYVYIYEANSCIERIQNSKALSPKTKDQLLGEALFSRAFCYFYLVNLFGDVPLVTSTDYRITDTIARSASASVYQQMVTDLTKAQSLLSPEYPTDNRVRPNLWTATALLSRVYLYTSKWADAESQATAIINSGSYSLSEITAVFGNASNETIWQLMPVDPSFNTQEAAYFIPGSSAQPPPFPLTNDLVNAFESGDNRLSTWTGNVEIGSQTYYYPYKYKISGGSPLNEYHIVFRLAEQFLIRAEARMQKGDVKGAIGDLNMIRSRAGLNTLSLSLTPAQTVTAIQQERRIELFAELGHRWLDLKRTHNVDLAIGALKPSTWRPTAALWPIPQEQRNLNLFLTQNKGY